MKRMLVGLDIPEEMRRKPIKFGNKWETEKENKKWEKVPREDPRANSRGRNVNDLRGILHSMYEGHTTGSISASMRPSVAISSAFLAPSGSHTLLLDVIVTPNSARSLDNHYE
ncbi:hypothetical protein AAG906_018905 [Vitis piasezkii]